MLDSQTDAWGIKVSNVEIKHVDLNENMVRAIARQAEAERERRAKVIHAEGELQAAEKLLQAAPRSRSSEAMQLRYLQTLTQIAGDKARPSCSRCRWTSSARCSGLRSFPVRAEAHQQVTHQRAAMGAMDHAERAQAKLVGVAARAK